MRRHSRPSTTSPDGEIGRRSGLKIRSPLRGVWVRLPLRAPILNNVDTYTEYSYSVLLEFPDGSKQVVWLGATSREEAKKEVAGTGVKCVYEHKAFTVVERVSIE